MPELGWLQAGLVRFDKEADFSHHGRSGFDNGRRYPESILHLIEGPEERTNLHGGPGLAGRESALGDRRAAFVARAGGPRPLPEVAKRPAELEGAFEDLDPASAELLRELGYLPR